MKINRIASGTTQMKPAYLNPVAPTRPPTINAVSRVASSPFLLTMHRVSAADFTVTTPSAYPAFFSINASAGSSSPTLTLVRGQTYTFSVNTLPGPYGHPFFINSPGVVNNNISLGTITYTVPTVASNYNYLCPIHLFGARILTVDPPAPTIRIVNLSVGTDIVLKSTGTNNWTLTPQYSTNLGTTNWFALTVHSNRFNNGTNETFCDVTNSVDV